AGATLSIERDNRLTLTSGLTDYGQGSRTVFTLIAAETLGVDPDRIEMLRPDTYTAIESGPTVASRSTMLGGNATRVAAEKLDRLLRYAAATSFCCSPAQVSRFGELYIDQNENELSFEQVVQAAREMGLTLSVQGKWSMPHIEWNEETGTGIPYYCYTFGAQVAEIEVDTRTGQIIVEKVWAAHDGGKIIFPQGAYGQVYGGVAQGLGYGVLEEITFNQGYLQSINYDTYMIPTALDVPEIEATFIEKEFPEGPYGAKNVAEPVLVATAPAIANAVYHATGVRHRTLPLTLERVLLGRALHPDKGERQCRAVFHRPV
ncbi:MAG: molybdopterin-dependent oxidoreductase, partial [Anaerolineales bacterium]|nr:molybdopterin-dependent oxidoreductase [Anaerolineales bacterium]